jgi:hypothetical protein
MRQASSRFRGVIDVLKFTFYESVQRDDGVERGVMLGMDFFNVLVHL